MTILDLQRIVQAPAKPRNAAAGQFSATQKELDVQLPLEWKQLAEVYGSGTFRASDDRHFYVWIYDPLSPGFPKRIRKICDEQRETEKNLGRTYELSPFYPDAGGYFPLGEDDCENTYWFHMIGQDWPIAIWGGFGAGRVQMFEGSIIDFLSKLLSGTLEIPGGPFTGEFVFTSDKST